MSKRITAGFLMLALTVSLGQNIEGRAASLSINKKKLTLTNGSSYTLKIKGISGKKTIVWKSSKKKVATVSPKGKVTARKKGTATITAKIKAKKFRCKVTVTAKQQTSVTPAPAATKQPALAKCPAATLPPVKSQRPVTTQKPVTTSYPAVTQRPGTSPGASYTWPPFIFWPSATQSPAATQNPGSSSVTEASAYQVLNSLRSTYPEGMTLTNSYYYYSPCFGNGYGCYGFAAKLSDTVFGTNKSCSTHTSFDKIKVGDNIRIGNYHSVIVLTKSQNSITVVEGNYNSSVHWDRTITQSSLAKEGFKVTTRY
ncbi:MAG: Ig-like domain-containing protein [Lachnospiraceae bacterium]|nr:Ig-like domain-containing protein [Lachnospiraceae bacterium]